MADKLTITGAHVSSEIPSVSVEPYEVEDRYGDRFQVHEYVGEGGVRNPRGYVYGYGLKVKKDGTVGAARSNQITPAGGVPEAVLVELERVSAEYLAAHPATN